MMMDLQPTRVCGILRFNNTLTTANEWMDG